MRICIVSEHYTTRTEDGTLCIGGTEASAYRLARELAGRHEITVVCSRRPGTPAEEVIDGYPVVRVGPEIPYTQFGYKWRRVQFVRAARRQVARLDADVVLVFSLLAFWSGYAGARDLGAPAVAWVTDVWQGRWRQAVGAAAPAANLLERWLLTRQWSRYVAISGPVGEMLRDVGIQERRIAVIPPPLDVESIRAASPLETSGGPILCHVGRLVAYKGVGTVVRAAAILARSHPGLRLLVVGTGPEDASLARLAGDLGIADRVEFLGSGPDQSFAYRAMAAADVFCLASSVEGFGLVVPEAMIAGVPVACSDIPALRWVTGDGAHARLFPVGDAERLADAVEAHLRDSDEAGRRAAAAREWATQFEPVRVSRAIESLLEEAAAERGRKG
jgi:glycosyltransferase involved in cell wall biosynthesis